jgi:hypothetical protein
MAIPQRREEHYKLKVLGKSGIFDMKMRNGNTLLDKHHNRNPNLPLQQKQTDLYMVAQG